MAQKIMRQDRCSKCNCKLDNKNNQPKSYSVHHCLPVRHFHGIGKTIVLCWSCHNALEAIIKSAEGKGKNRLNKKAYEMLCTNFIHSVFWDREY